MSDRVIVVGAGIIGTSTAYYLSRLGVDVTLIESNYIASGTSAACDQGILMQTKKPGPTLTLAMESASIYETLEDELGADLEYRQGGSMIIMETEKERAMVNEHAKALRDSGLNISILSGKDIREKQPELGEHVLGATWWERDAKVNSMKVCYEMANAAERLGTHIIEGRKVTGLVKEGEHIIGVEMSGETLYADAVVLTSGIWTAELMKTIGVDIPIIPRRGQILVTEKLPKILHSNILSGAYIAAKKKGAGEDSDNPAGIGLVMGQVASGNILIGGSREFVGFNTNTTDNVIRGISAEAARVFPYLDHVRVIRAFAGLRPFTSDGFPLIGPVERLPGLFIAAGHEGDGIALAPVTGKVMAELVCGKEPFMDLSPFSPDRFFDNYNR
mgnify:CR=1 FL=1